MTEWEEEIENSEEERLIRSCESLTYINLHNAYHIGQIVHIRKDGQFWDKGQGVDYTI